MNVSGPFIRRPVGTSLLAIGLVLLGGDGVFFSPRSPASAGGLSDDRRERIAARRRPRNRSDLSRSPLERRLGQIAGVTEMTSASSLGGSTVTVQFDLSRNVNDAARDVQAAINAAARDLPANLPNPPTYRKYNPSDSASDGSRDDFDDDPALGSLQLRGSDVLSDCARSRDQPGRSIWGRKNRGARSSESGGSRCDGDEHGDVRGFLQSTNRLMPKGNIEDAGKNVMVSANDQIFGAENYRPLVVAEPNGLPVQLGRSQTLLTVRNTRQAGWFNNERAVLLPVMKQSDANVIAVVDEIRALLPQIRSGCHQA